MPKVYITIQLNTTRYLFFFLEFLAKGCISPLDWDDRLRAYICSKKSGKCNLVYAVKWRNATWYMPRLQKNIGYGISSPYII